MILHPDLLGARLIFKDKAHVARQLVTQPFLPDQNVAGIFVWQLQGRKESQVQRVVDNVIELIVAALQKIGRQFQPVCEMTLPPAGIQKDVVSR